ncbi:MAG: DNA translocase FtsK [Candidatus Omnitrophica bacterium]|nr:DNA translocase FtsK [Candidatus Omnitrophota bacterium]
MQKKHINEIYAVVLFALGVILLLSLASYTPLDLSFYSSHPNLPVKNLVRGFGAHLSGILIFFFGWGSYLFCLLLFYTSIRLFRQEEIDFRLPQFIGLVFFLLSTSSLLSMLGSSGEHYRFMRGGYFGFILSHFITTYFGNLGGFVIFITLCLLSFILVTEILVSHFFLNIYRRLAGSFTSWGASLFNLKSKLFRGNVLQKRPRPVEIKPRPVFSSDKQDEPVSIPKIERPSKPPLAPKIQIKTESKPLVATVKPKAVSLPEGKYQLPSLDLLDSPPPLEERKIKDDLTANARILEETLGDFGISVKVTDIERGPVITRYELEPAPGVKLNRIVNLGDDIALAMKAQSVRIVAPIPGKARVGIEVPNTQSSFVYLKEVLGTEEFQRAESKLTLALGKDIAGKPIVADLGQMPHLLIAGTTGSGKTVCVNDLILSMLYKASPQEVKFLMVDPKMVELAVFNGLPHLLSPVLTDPKKVSVALKWLVNEMGERFQLFAKAGTRNIEAYNQKEERIPYIIVIIDELADLMMVAKDSVESAIARLAQLSRAVGIHLILATQRPSVDVITGVIKANFPARISFQVASKVDSRTVLDANGADKLLGKGDMLFLKPGETKLIRAQGSFVKDAEIQRVVDFIKAQAEPVYDEEIFKESKTAGFAEGEKDDLYDEAVRLVMETGQASVSILQRRMRLGYTRAARLIDAMEQAGLVGPYEGSKPRKILADRKEWLKQQMEKKEEGT